ncbi:hypothetical protein BGW36DRAFT_64091 [Talaromyces proteolyticus]|uniref:Uncharacterized protein n=1 Tax=Talaromyces proteolyticus TaxID=1131652 RepID=A0AAD4PSX3_9EURO|nr:uncharacterized protein BGW36DRAFT_64091 [Talaromyces proteolyticus]KAH8689844.1 hypothetical protein BGW36DRAFT_64091 [Talaromyces proteolyticus]
MMPYYYLRSSHCTTPSHPHDYLVCDRVVLSAFLSLWPSIFMHRSLGLSVFLALDHSTCRHLNLSILQSYAGIVIRAFALSASIFLYPSLFGRRSLCWALAPRPASPSNI